VLTCECLLHADLIGNALPLEADIHVAGAIVRQVANIQLPAKPAHTVVLPNAEPAVAIKQNSSKLLASMLVYSIRGLNRKQLAWPFSSCATAPGVI
jgi:hypothetical protein